MVQSLEPAGVNRAWIVQVRKSIHSGKEVWSAAEQLVQVRSGLVDSIDERS